MKISSQKQIINEQVDSIVEQIHENKDNYKICRFHLSELPNNHDWELKPETNPIFKEYFEKLFDYKRDCLYWFSCDTKEEAVTLNNALTNYRDKGKRAVPTSNKYLRKDKTVYVGVRCGSPAKNPTVATIVGRINQHLGYYEQPKTQGLQLYHWAKDLDMHITLHVVHFEEAIGALLYVLEKEMSKRLVPHCGRH